MDSQVAAVVVVVAGVVEGYRCAPGLDGLRDAVNLVAGQDEGAAQVNEEKQRTDFKWTDDLIAHYKVINENAAAHPIIEIAEGCIDDNDIQQMFVNSDTQGLKAALHGVEWSQTREEFYDLINTMVSDIDGKLKAQG